MITLGTVLVLDKLKILKVIKMKNTKNKNNIVLLALLGAISFMPACIASPEKDMLVPQFDQNYGYLPMKWGTCTPGFACYGNYYMYRPYETATEVADRAIKVAEVMRNTSYLPASALDPNSIGEIATEINNNPDEFYILDGTYLGDTSEFTYRVRDNYLMVRSVDLPVIPDPLPNPAIFDDGIGKTTAEGLAEDLIEDLENNGTIGTNKFTNLQSSYTHQTGGSGNEGWAIDYGFTYTPLLDGVPLLSCQLDIEINALTGEPSLVRLIDHEYIRMGDAIIDTDYLPFIEGQLEYWGSTQSQEIPANTPVYDGEIGYYMPYEYTAAYIPPMYVANWLLPAESSTLMHGINLSYVWAYDPIPLDGYEFEPGGAGGPGGP